MHKSLPPLLLTLSFWAAVASVGVAQERRYFIRPRAVQDIDHATLIQQVSSVAGGGEIVHDLNYPKFRFNAVVLNLTDIQRQNLADANPGLLIVPDADIVRTGSNGGPLGPWGATSLTSSGFPTGDACCSARPVVYVVDTGIRQTHSAFSTGTFLTGMTEGWDYNLNIPVPPDLDAYDHGTRMAGVLMATGGIGLLPKLNAAAYLKSVQCYDIPAATGSTFASTVIAALMDAATDHDLRKATGYVKDHASVVLLAQSTLPVGGRFGDLDRAIEEVWNAGLTVVVSAGNYAVLAAEVSPAGAAIGYLPAAAPWTNPPTIVVDPGHYWFGPKPPAANFARWLPHFIVGGAHDCNNALWGMTDTNNAAVDPVDVFAPGVSIRCATNAGDLTFGYGDGTSYGAAFTAATAAFLAYHKPWLAPDQIRNAINAARIATGPNWSRLAVPAALPGAGLSFVNWTAHHGLAGVDATAEADPDQDSLPNLIEYYCGMSPKVNDSAIRPSITPNVVAGNVKISLPVACYLPSNVSLRLEKSTDMNVWSAVALSSYSAESPCRLAGDGRYFDGSAPLTIASGGKEFFRLRVTSP